MPTDIGLDASGDLPVRPQHIDGVALTRQRLERRLRTHLGEWFADIRVGIPYLDLAATRPFPLQSFVALVQVQIATCPGVASETEFSASQDGETVTITASVTLDQQPGSCRWS